MKESQDINMKYFFLTVSQDEKIIGKYPQVKTDTKPFEWLLPPLKDQIRCDNFLDFETYFDIILSDDANLTDVIERASLSWGLVVNKKFKSIVSNFNLPPHRFYPINVFHRGKSSQYYWFHFYDNMFKYVDLNNSYFEVFSKPNYNIIETLPITSEKFIREKQNTFFSNQNMRIKEVIFNNSFPQYDLFENNIWGFSNIISDRLKLRMTEHHITGIEFSECGFLNAAI